MDTQKITTHWIESSDKDFETMNHLFQTKDYHWALFLGHLVIEKLGLIDKRWLVKSLQK
ncbi:MAG: HEPN domain-containing protein [Cytophagales bacterium]|nr:HEPN domain-containing protein [Cytophagales bacterium]